jgi:hypothetical protein
MESNEPKEADPTGDRTRRLTKRYVSLLFVSFAGVFVALSAYQLAVAVYGVGIQALPVQSMATLGCATELRGLVAAVDRAILSAARATDDAGATAAYRAALSPEWDAEPNVVAHCSSDGRGADAFAAVARFRRAGESFVRHQVIELAPLRQDVAAYLLP